MDITFSIVYTNRQTISLTVNREGNLVVRAPRRATISYIEELIQKQREWIARSLEHHARHHQPRNYAEGEMFLYLGKEYRLRVSEAFRSRIVFDGAFYVSKFKLHQAKSLLAQWYKQEAKRAITESAHCYARAMGVEYKKITIRDTSSRWGSCSSQKNLNFSFRLVMAPQEVLDYVVVHELAHLTHLNHSGQFWQLVKKYSPGFQAHRCWLREQGSRLRI